MTEESEPLGVSSDEPEFFEGVFETLACKATPSSPVEFENDPLLNASQARNVFTVRKMALQLVDDGGNLHLEKLDLAIEFLQKNLFTLGPGRHLDAPYQKHLLMALQQLKNDKEIQRLFKSIGKPVSFPQAEQLIRDTLGLQAGFTITEAHTMRAVLVAWLTYLRQSVGSCFATAPAILIHNSLPIRLLTDLRDLLSLGFLKRTIGGVEHTVPLSRSWGMGNLRQLFWVDKDFSLFLGSYGFLSALEAAGVWHADLSLIKKREKARTLLIHAMKKGYPSFTEGFLSVDMALQYIFMDQNHLTQKDLQDLADRPPDLLTGLIMIQTTPKGTFSKAEAGTKYQKQYTAAKNAFRAITESALLKAWEFTIASFCDTKAQFTRWNLYKSLGLGAKDENGIGQCLYLAIERHWERCKRELEEWQTQYEKIFLELKALEGIMRDTASEQKLNWMRLDYQGRHYELEHLLEKRDAAYAKAQKWSKLFAVLIEKYDELFPTYFQEVYDAEMLEVTITPFEDSPAGFRLLCKHGRSHPALWTMITTPSEFIEALCEFFVMTEQEVTRLEVLEGMENDVGHLITEIVTHVRTNAFLESTLHRMALAHGMQPIADPTKNLEKITKKPWAYTSGGTMAHLITVYFSLPQPPKQEGKWVENETELGVFLLDTLKTLPTAVFSPKKAISSFLMHSPSHAFVMKPNFPLFSQGWKEEGTYTYTWLRDRYIHPTQDFLDRLYLDERQLAHLLELFAQKLPENFRHPFKRSMERLPAPLTPRMFCEWVENQLSYERWVKQVSLPFSPLLHTLLFNHLPLFSSRELGARVEKIFLSLPPYDRLMAPEAKKLVEKYASSHETFLGPKELLNTTKAILLLLRRSLTSSEDDHLHIVTAMRELGFALPEPMLFADSNWPNDYLGFLVNPGTYQLELWKMDYSGIEGEPLIAWKKWLDGSHQDPWVVYTHPHEYGL